MGAVANPISRRPARECRDDIDAFALQSECEAVVRDDLPSRSSSPTVAASSGGTTGCRHSGHGERGAAGMEFPIRRVVEGAAADHATAKQLVPAASNHEGADEARSMTGIRALMADPVDGIV